MEGDFVHKRYLRDNERYADLINGVVFEGRQVIKSENLTEQNEQTGIDKPANNRYSTRKKEKSRDVVKKVSFGINFMVIGVEGQSKTDYLMALRNLSYEVMEYEKQAALKRKEVRGDKTVSKEDYVSGFRKTDRLHPCVLFVMYYGKSPWDGQPELHDILDMQDVPDELKKYIHNYQVHVIDVRRMKNTNVFRTDLKQIFDFLQCAEDKVKLQRLVASDEKYQNMDEDAYDLLAEYANSEEMISMKTFSGEERKVNMCKGLKDWATEEREAGRCEGIEQGIEQTRIVSLRSVIKNFGVSLEQALQVLMVPAEEWDKYRNLV